MSRTLRHALGLVVTLTLLVPVASGQTMSQTLPAGYGTTRGNDFTNWPQNTATPQIWQWHYDSNEFAAGGEIEIVEIWVRAHDPTSTVAAFDFPGMEVTLIEASTDYRAGSHDPDFADNVRRAEVVQSGWSGGPVAASGRIVSDWVPLHLEHAFTYDPTRGNDFIIQLRKCTTNTTWGTSMDVAFASSNLGGNRYGHSLNCTATSQNSAGSEVVPIVRIDYRPVFSQTLPAGFDNLSGNGGTNWPIATSNDQTWQWVYDSGEFVDQDAIAITEIFIRADSSGVTVPAFEFASFEVALAWSLTDYTIQSATFANNYSIFRTVKAGPWRGGPTPPAGGAQWIPLQLDRPFLFSAGAGFGSDLIVQLRSCTPLSHWGVPMDVHVGLGIGGNSYGHSSSCTATMRDVSYNERAPIVKINYVPAEVTTFPWTETFDGHGAEDDSDAPPPGWDARTNANQSWWFRSRPTPSTGTGPQADHTTGIPGQGFYAYLEDSLNSSSIELTTPVIDITGLTDPVLGFWVHSFDASGQNPNTIDVFVNDISPTVLATIGDLGVDEWQYHEVSLAGLSNRFFIDFLGNTNNGTFTHDIAIDDITIFDRVTPPGQAPQSFAEMDVNEALNVNFQPVAFGAAGPYFTDAAIGGGFDLRFEGQAAQPIVLLWGPLNPGLVAYPNFGQFDIGTGLAGLIPSGIGVVADGLNPSSLLDYLFFTNASGELKLPFLTPVLPYGTKFTLQAAMFHSTGAQMTNAVEVTIVP